VGGFADVGEQLLTDGDFGDLLVVERASRTSKDFDGSFIERHGDLLVMPTEPSSERGTAGKRRRHVT
jgi:hypothetical protein